MPRKLILIVLMGLMTNWAVSQNYNRRKILKDIRELPGFEHAYVGFKLFDPGKDKVIARHYDDKYMTPASNTKLFTFFAGLKALDDAVPAMKYTVKGDSLIFWGTGNPLFLHPEIGDTAVLDFLRSRPENLFYWVRPSDEDRYGPGWSWDDYNGYYSAEKSIFPIYGNSTRSIIDRSGGMIKTYPSRLANNFALNADSSERNSIRRVEFDNDYTYQIGKPDAEDSDSVELEEYVRPFLYSNDLFRKLLADTLKKAVRPYDSKIDLSTVQTLYSLPIDTLYKRMLQPSDNLLAEQILMMISDQLGDTLSTQKAIEHIQENHFTDWEDEVIWVDGSGLSRYNMFTPRTIVTLLERLRSEIGEEKLFELLPAGGVSGTIENWYAGENEPYVFAKTGTLSNNHCLSGYIKTRKGKTLIFSFMVNHYAHSTNKVRQSMQIMLEKIRDAY